MNEPIRKIDNFFCARSRDVLKFNSEFRGLYGSYMMGGKQQNEYVVFEGHEGGNYTFVAEFADEGRAIEYLNFRQAALRVKRAEENAEMVRKQDLMISTGATFHGKPQESDCFHGYHSQCHGCNCSCHDHTEIDRIIYDSRP